MKNTTIGKFMAKYITITPAADGESLEVTVARHDEVLGQLLAAGEDGFVRLVNLEDMMAQSAATQTEHTATLATVATKADLAGAIANLTTGEGVEARRVATAKAVVDELVGRLKSPGAKAQIAAWVVGLYIAIQVALAAINQVPRP